MYQSIETAEIYKKAAQSKTSGTWCRLFVLAVAAGAFIAFGGVFSVVAGAAVGGSAASIVRGAVFPLGLILVVVCGAELFTGNSLLIAPLLNRDIKLAGLLRNWGIAYFGNISGAVVVAVLVVFGRVYGDAACAAAIASVAAKCDADFLSMMLKGVLCNMLVCLAVWSAISSKSIAGKIIAVYFPVFAFVACGFEHSVANMYYIASSFMISNSGLSFGVALLNGLIAPTIGNIIGGGLIAVLFWITCFEHGNEKVDGSEN